MQDLLFIFNPNTGGGRLKTKLMSILCAYSHANYRVTVLPTRAHGDARRFAAEYGESFSKVICCGGDGTLNEVVDGLMSLEKRPVLGYIPGGTTNDFASSLRLPRSDMIAACERTIHPKKIYKCDVGRLNRRHFTYVAAFGAFTDVSYGTPQAFKNVFGYYAYIVEGAQRLPNIQSYKLQVEYDGQTLEDEFVFGMVSNSTSVGGFSFSDKVQVRMDDGLFEVLLVKKPNKLLDIGGISAALIGRNIDSPWVVALQGSKIKFTFEDEVPWTMDGEFGGNHEKVEIDINSRALEICI